jgi:aldehyde dehydrogenase (NAD+)
MINHRGFERAVKSLEQARAAGKTIIGGQVDEEQNKMAPAVVLLNEGAKEEDTNLVLEEIFGPILPVIPVEV